MPLNVVPFFSTLASPCLVDTHQSRLRSSGARVIDASQYLSELRSNDAILHDRTLIHVGTGGTERLVVDFIDDSGLPSPIFLLSHPKNNSLPAALEVKAHLSEIGHDVVLLHDALDSIVAKLAEWVVHAEKFDMIRKKRIGTIGRPSSWLVASDVDPERVHDIWGVQLVSYDLSVLNARAEPAQPLAANPFLSGAKASHVPETEVEKATQLAYSLERFMKAENLDAVTVQCFEFLQSTQVSGCLALSHVNNIDTLTAGCEGDVPSIFTMVLVKELTGTSGFMANVTGVDVSSSTVSLAHCTVPTSLADSYELKTHAESDKSVGIQGNLPKGPVTLLKVFGRGLDRFWVAGGTLVDIGCDEEECRTQVRIKLDSDVHYFLKEPLGNHHVVVLGNHVALFKDFLSFVLPRV